MAKFQTIPRYVDAFEVVKVLERYEDIGKAMIRLDDGVELVVRGPVKAGEVLINSSAGAKSIWNKESFYSQFQEVV